MRTLCKRLELYPGDHIHLIFGAVHLFDRARVPIGYRVPRITMTTFPGIAALHPSFQVPLVNRFRSDRGLLRAYLDKLDFVDPAVFGMLDASEQILVLEKPLLVTPGTPDRLEETLRRQAKDDRVAAAIDRGIRKVY